jgi:Flp pilus assembly pilin Flp
VKKRKKEEVKADLKDIRGASSVEYALLVVGIASAIVLAVSMFGQIVKQLFETASQIFKVTP